MPRKAFFLLFVVYGALRGLAQDDPRITELLKKADGLAIANYDSALKICDNAIDLSKKKGALHNLAQAYKLKGYCLYFKGNYPAALEFYQQAEKLSEEKGYKDVLLSLHNLQGTFYKKQNRLKEALAEFRSGERLAKELGSPVQEANFKSDIGLVYEL